MAAFYILAHHHIQAYLRMMQLHLT